MESVIFAGLLISGYLANECNDDNKNKQKKHRLNKQKHPVERNCEYFFYLQLLLDSIFKVFYV